VPAAKHFGVEWPSSGSPYSQRGMRLPYEIVITTNANGPRVKKLSQRPGVLYYSVSSDLQEVWMTMTALQNDVASRADLKRVADRPDKEVWVVGAAGRNYPILEH
jgi:hypothetical protein